MIRRVIASTVAGLCAVIGPAAAPVRADDGAAFSVSDTQLRPGVVFTVTPQDECPADAGPGQTVRFTYADGDEQVFDLGEATAEDDGTWAPTELVLPTLGLQSDDSWLDPGVTAGAGQLRAECGLPDGGDEGDEGDGGDGAHAKTDDGTVTQTYTPLAVTVTGEAAGVTVSDDTIEPGVDVSVTPVDPCPAAGEVEVTLRPAYPAEADDPDPDDPGTDDPGDPGTDDPGTDDPGTGTGGDGTDITLATRADGTWTPVTLTLPADATTGDYALSTDCYRDGALTGTYEDVPVAVGTVTVAAPSCTARGASVAVTGTYGGLASAMSVRAEGFTLPATLKLTGNRPWTVSVNSAFTGQQLVTDSVTCPPRYDLDVPRYGINSAGALQVRVCNSGNATVTGRLQTLNGRRWVRADDEVLEGTDCTWLTTGRLRPGATVSARLLIDAPGKGADDVVQSFKSRRPR